MSGIEHGWKHSTHNTDLCNEIRVTCLVRLAVHAKPHGRTVARNQRLPSIISNTRDFPPLGTPLCGLPDKPHG